MINRTKLEHILEYARQQRRFGQLCKILPGDMVEIVEIAMRKTGNSPVTPDGWVMVPKQVTPEISNAINVVGQRCTCGNCSQRLWDLLLDATQQGVNRG
ncbi:hypothetical protein CRE37_003088 [Escherichia coli]|nr:hypothetical protein [Escherichia coli]EFC8796773.1 hypothetical protein [Escherichia coli]EFF9449368.1 hypothetical protein [Escherichia coli]EFH7175660.1 hypothetical protein [Escherichia coli]